MIRTLLNIFRGLAVLGSLGRESTAGPVITGPARVIDGDTIEVAGQRIRLYGIDAPEMGQPCTDPHGTYDAGAEARRALHEITDGEMVTCQPLGRDRYGRTLAEVRNNRWGNVNATMVRAGWALDYETYSKGRYLEHQDEARAAKRGLWAGAFILPGMWRRNTR
ncbi:MAG: thermonuclease family protein [Alphaproteobacteria bacterium]